MMIGDHVDWPDNVIKTYRLRPGMLIGFMSLSWEIIIYIGNYYLHSKVSVQGMLIDSGQVCSLDSLCGASAY